jgi:hypothetical protein
MATKRTQPRRRRARPEAPAPPWLAALRQALFTGFPQFWSNNERIVIIVLIEGPLLWKLSTI